MKIKILLFCLLTFLGKLFSQSSTVKWESFNYQETIWAHFQGGIYYKAPCLVTIASSTKKPLRVSFNLGTIRQLNDSVFEVTPFHWGEYRLSINGRNPKSYITTGQVEELPAPYLFYLEGAQDSVEVDFLKGVVQQSIGKPLKIKANYHNFSYEVKEFECRLNIYGAHQKHFASPVFHTNILDWDVLKNINLNGEFAELIIDKMKVVGSDSIVRELNDRFFTFNIYPDSSYLLIDKYLQYRTNQLIKVKSDVRIKLEGKPAEQDKQTINNIISELNKTVPNLNIKLVNRFPSVSVYIDSTDDVHGEGALTGTTHLSHINPFFPLLSTDRIFINSKIPQKDRDLLLWKFICRSLAEFRTDVPEVKNSILMGVANQPKLSTEDKLALKAIFAGGSDKKIRLLKWIKPPVPSTNILLVILFGIILFFVLNETSKYYNISSIVRNSFVRDTLSILIYAQILVLMVKYIIPSTQSREDDSFSHYFYLYEVYIISFSLIAFGLFKAGSQLTVKLKARWLQMVCNPLISAFILWFVYQVMYLFVRGEFLRFQTIDIVAMTIGLAIISVHFYLDYESNKIKSLVREKEFELTKLKEMHTRAELNALQARINPHFLYNALNSLASLALTDARRTEKMALNLSRLFRYNTNRKDELTCTLAQEIEMVQLYLDIEKQRFGDRLTIIYEIEESTKQREIPKFLLQPLVENAVKHGVAVITEQAFIKLRLFESSNGLIIEIHDNGPAFPQGLVSGYGLQNTNDKLNLIYKKPYQIKFANEPDKFIQITLY